MPAVLCKTAGAFKTVDAASAFTVASSRQSISASPLRPVAVVGANVLPLPKAVPQVLSHKHESAVGWGTVCPHWPPHIIEDGLTCRRRRPPHCARA